MKKIGFIDLDGKATIKDLTVITKYNGSRFHFFCVPFAITKEKAIELQTEAGYPPAGYGFYGFDPTISQTVWKCLDSCD